MTRKKVIKCKSCDEVLSTVVLQATNQYKFYSGYGNYGNTDNSNKGLYLLSKKRNILSISRKSALDWFAYQPHDEHPDNMCCCYYSQMDRICKCGEVIGIAWYDCYDPKDITLSLDKVKLV